MKKLLPLALCLMLLAGCGKAPADPSPTPPPPEPSPTVSVQLPLAWWAELGSDALPQPGDQARLSDGSSVRCLAALESPDVSAYLVLHAQRNTPELYLREGDRFYDLGAPSLLFDAPETRLSWSDLDGDGGEELLLILREGQRSLLAVARRGQDSWTYQPYDTYGQALEAALDYRYEPFTATVTYGRESASYTLGANESGRIGLHTDFSGYSFFNASGTDLSAMFGVGVDVNGQVRYFATVSADVEYDGTGFTLRNLSLTSIGGV